MHNTTIKLQPSRYLQYGLLTLHSLVFCVLLLLPITVFLKSALLLWVCLSFCYNWAQHVRSSAKRALTACTASKNSWCLTTQAGTQHDATLLSYQRIGNVLLVLRWREHCSRKIHTACIFPDSITQEDWRALNVMLHLG